MGDSFRLFGLELRNNVFLAPMAGITNRPFRRVAYGLGCELAWTEMVSAEGLVRGDEKTRTYLPDREEGGRVAVQLFGHRPETLRDAALMVADGPASFIDINLGCPVRKIVKGGGGGALLRSPPAVRKILEAVCAAVSKPVTIKIRSGWDERNINAIEIARLARDCGVSAVILHARTVRQGFGGRADWRLIGEVAEKAGLPVIGNGDLRIPAEVEKALHDSGCAAVMIGRGALGRPWIFRDVENYRRGSAAGGVTAAEVGRLMVRHLDLSVEEFGPKRGLLLMRRPLSWYSRGLPGAAEFRRRVNGTESSKIVRQEIEVLTGLDGDQNTAAGRGRENVFSRLFEGRKRTTAER